MPQTKIGIIQNAVNLLNTGTIVSISDADDFATSVGNTFDYLLEDDIANNDWRFATALTPLSRLVQIPIIDNYRYIYLLPADYITLHRLWPLDKNYMIMQDKHLYANGESYIAEYRFVPHVSKLPSYYVKYFIELLASRLALTGAGSEDLSEKIQKWADFSYNRAISIDSKAHPNQPFDSNSLEDVRNA